MTPEERGELLMRNRNRWTAEERARASVKAKAQWARWSPEERLEHLHKSFNSEATREKFRMLHKNMTDAEKQEWVARSFHNPEAKRLAIIGMRKGLKKWWASLSPEQKMKEIEKRVLPSRLVCSNKRPTDPERAVQKYLNKKFPNEWRYNGYGAEGVIFGGKVPDFVNINGKKQVLEVFGQYWHQPKEVEPLKEHYRKFGFKCIIIWERDCYSPERLDKILCEV